eukprot:g54698.t1
MQQSYGESSSNLCRPQLLTADPAYSLCPAQDTVLRLSGCARPNDVVHLVFMLYLELTCIYPYFKDHIKFVLWCRYY